MEILLIRHAYPDYANDTLTEVGHEEARLLAKRLQPVRIDKIYVSPAGRAQATARPTSDVKGVPLTTLGWLNDLVLPYLAIGADTVAFPRTGWNSRTPTQTVQRHFAP